MAGSVNMPKILVCGAGSIGRRHIINLIKLGAQVSVWRSQTHLLKLIQKEFNVQIFKNLDEAIDKADAVVIATATDNHIKLAEKVLEAGKPMFIEKPLSHNWDGIENLQRLASDKIIEVGCQFRAHQNLIALARELHQTGDKTLTYRLAMGHRLNAWRKDKDYRKAYSSDANRGGGALFDLIHQIDLATWFFGPVTEVTAVLSKMSDLEISCDDVSNILLTHGNGLTGHIQLDMASPVYRCEAEVMTSSSIFKWAYSEGVLHKNSAEESVIIDKVSENFERNDLFLSHMTHFLKRLINKSLPAMCSLEDGIAVLRVAICAREANLLNKRIIV